MGARLDRALETVSFGVLPATHDVQGSRGEDAPTHRDDQAPAFDPETVSAASVVIGVNGPRGVDYWRLCFVHKWASADAVSNGLAQGLRCPHCDADADGGRERYRELVTRIAVIGG